MSYRICQPAVRLAVCNGCSGCGLMDISSVVDRQREEGRISITCVGYHSPREEDEVAA